MKDGAPEGFDATASDVISAHKRWQRDAVRDKLTISKTNALDSISVPTFLVNDDMPWELALVFLIVFLIYLASPVISTGDSHFVIPTALSIIRHGDANIDEYHALFHEAPWAVFAEKGHFWNRYPIGVPFLILPCVWIWDKAAALFGVDLESAIIGRYPGFMDLCFASLIMSGAVALLFLYCRRKLSLPRALLLVFLFAFGTPAYSSASRGLWQHAPSTLLFFAAVLLYDTVPAGFASRLALGTIVGYSYAVRPTNSLLMVGFFALLLVEGRRWLLPYAAGVVMGAIPLFTFNLTVFGMWTSSYYRLLVDGFEHGSRYSDAYLGLLISPSRGLLIFSPFVILVLLRFTQRYRVHHPWTRLEILLGLLCVAWWAATAQLPFWVGGGSYGPRLSSELFPCFVILLIPLVQNLSLELDKGRIITVLFVVTGALSVAIHLRGATAWATQNDWNIGPPDINAAPEKVWRWRDPQFLKGLGWWTSDRTMVSAEHVSPHPCEALTSFASRLVSSLKAMTLHPSQQLTIPLRIENPGPETWDSGGSCPVNVSYKWFAGDHMLPIEGERTALPSAVGPNHGVDLQVRVIAPTQPGNFDLRITLVQESVAWFMLKSNSFLQLQVTVK